MRVVVRLGCALAVLALVLFIGRPPAPEAEAADSFGQSLLFSSTNFGEGPVWGHLRVADAPAHDPRSPDRRR